MTDNGNVTMSCILMLNIFGNHLCFKVGTGSNYRAEGEACFLLSHRKSEKGVKRDTEDKELLVVMMLLLECEVYHTDVTISIHRDHEDIKDLQKKERLSKEQIRWLEELQPYIIKYEEVKLGQNGATEARSTLRTGI